MNCLNTMFPEKGIRFLGLVEICLAAGWLAAGLSLPIQTQEIDFIRQVKPILSDRCYICHGPDQETREADLRLDLLDDAQALLAAGDPGNSELLRRIESADPTEIMPPPESKLLISAEEKKIMRQWIAEGARWDRHWSFVPIEAVAPPAVVARELIRNPIDQFVLQRLEQRQETFAPAIPPEKLLRRLSFDLTGLSPTVEELDHFLAAFESNPDEAVEQAIDRLLASPHYGERMAAWWLDLARYSDTFGYQVDRGRFVWPWRDWVVQAFNDNLSYDQFITEQLAGDLLPNPTDQQILATTFNRLHPQKVEGGSIEEEFRTEYVADRTNTFGMALLGLTVECARCHDHKYDPLSMKEYYQLFAFFNNIDESGLYSFFDPGSTPTPTLKLMGEPAKVRLRELQAKEQQAAESFRNFLAAQLTRLAEDPADSRFADWLAERASRPTDEAVPAKPPAGLIYQLDPEQLQFPNGNGNAVERPENEPLEIVFSGDDELNTGQGKFDRYQSFSVSTQFKIPTQSEGQTIERNVIFHCSRASTDSASRGYQLLIEEGKLSAALIHFWPGNAICVRTVEPLPAGQWHQVTLTYDGSSRASGLRIFVNGVIQPVEVIKDHLNRTILGSGTDSLIIGARFRDRGFSGGRIRDLQIFDRELTELDVLSLVNPSLISQATVELLEGTVPAAGDNSGGMGKAKGQVSAAPSQWPTRFHRHYVTTELTEANQLKSQLQAIREELNQFQDQQTEIMVMQEMPQPRQTYVLNRGAYDARGESVQAETPRFLPALPATSNPQPDRLDLARWMLLPEHPLTARVAINQLWQLVFGTGLVRTPEDFGSQSDPPFQRELLDWLARDFQTDWDLKRAVRQMVMSRTYQQSAYGSLTLMQTDPDNEWLGRANRFRLTAEMLRDNILRQSGLLVDSRGGPPVRPYDLELGFVPISPDSGDGLYRRSLYTYWKRTGASPAMVVLDAPNRDVCQVQREKTSSPLQGLVMLNGTQFVEGGRKLSEKWLTAHSQNPSEIARGMFRSLTSRSPRPEELAVLLDLFEKQLASYQADPAAAEELLGVGQSPTGDLNRIELAAWTTVACTLLVHDECVIRQ
jgi:hypothetical protein